VTILEPPNPDVDRRGIQSVEIGFRLVEALCIAPVPLSLRDLAAAAQLPPSNCHRYCVSFVRTGYLSQDSRTGRYGLGPRLIQAGLTALGRTDAVGLATEALERLVDESGHTGQLAVWGNAGPTIVRWIPGRAAVRVSLTTGAQLPILTSATGHVFLAFLPARQTEVLVASEIGDRVTDTAALVAQTRAAGFARVSGEHIPGLSAAAAPILDVHGEAAAVVTLVAAREGISSAAVNRLRSEAQETSRRLGWALSNDSACT
jgi:DNA-binding IclR family transcriptional regulator